MGQGQVRGRTGYGPGLNSGGGGSTAGRGARRVGRGGAPQETGAKPVARGRPAPGSTAPVPPLARPTTDRNPWEIPVGERARTRTTALGATSCRSDSRSTRPSADVRNGAPTFAERLSGKETLKIKANASVK